MTRDDDINVDDIDVDDIDVVQCVMTCDDIA
jgi:hypothetical protein